MYEYCGFYVFGFDYSSNDSRHYAYLYITHEYEKINKFFLAWVTMSTMILAIWFGVGLYLYFNCFL